MRPSARLVGRDADLAVLRDRLGGVAHGLPATVIIGGEAGVGKSRLLREFVNPVSGTAGSPAAGAATGPDDTNGSAARVLLGACYEQQAEGLPYAPFTAALRGLVATLGRTGIADLLPTGRPAELSRVLPGLGEPDTEADPDSARARLFEHVLALLANLAAQQPTILAIEDTHWAAASSRDLLDFVIRNQQAAPGLMVVATLRPDELTRSHPLRPMLAELDRVDWVHRHRLERLSKRETAQQIHGIVGTAPRPELVDDVFRRSDGNPLFVEALLEASGDAALPESLRDLLLRQVRQLPDRTQEVTRIAAVGGVRIPHTLLAAIAGRPDTELSDALRPAIAANTLVVDGDYYSFRHALIRDAVYDDQLPGDRIRAHIHYAEALEADPALAADERVTIEIAHHWYAAGDAPRALEAIWRAAADAQAAVAYSDQLRLLTQVLELWPKVTNPDARVGASRLDIVEHAAEAARLAGEAEAGVRLTTAAMGITNGTEDPARVARLLELRGGLLHMLGRDGDVDELRKAVRLVPPDHPTRAHVLASLAQRLMLIPEHDEARDVGCASLELARATGDRRTEAFALVLVSTLHARFGELGAELPNLHQAQRIADEIGAHDLLARAISTEAHLRENFGEHEQAADVARRGIAVASDLGLARSHSGMHMAALASSLISLGRWDDAVHVIDDAVELLPPPLISAELMNYRAAIAVTRGDAVTARNAIDAPSGIAGADANLVFPVARVRLDLHLLAGDTGAALAVVRRTMADHDLQGSTRYVWPFLAAGARVAGLAGDGDALAELRSHADKLQAFGPVQEAHRLTFHAEAQRAAGNPDPEAWEAAVTAWDELHQPYRTAQARLGAAEAMIAADVAPHDRRKAASVHLRRAAELADGLRAAPLRTEIDTLARRARLAVPSAQARSHPIEELRGQLGLTNRELDVLRLIATGRDNHDIAAELFISPKTVSVHVSRILAKLGLSNRTEAAATAHRLGLT